jgi:hypothetical protein
MHRAITTTLISPLTHQHSFFNPHIQASQAPSSRRSIRFIPRKQILTPRRNFPVPLVQQPAVVAKAAGSVGSLAHGPDGAAPDAAVFAAPELTFPKVFLVSYAFFHGKGM